jgi:hypothetical protein
MLSESRCIALAGGMLLGRMQHNTDHLHETVLQTRVVVKRRLFIHMLPRRSVDGRVIGRIASVPLTTWKSLIKAPSAPSKLL